MKSEVVLFICVLTFYLSLAGVSAQTNDTVWTLNRCIEYALGQNISIQKSKLTGETEKVNMEKAKAARFPSVNASASFDMRWNKTLDQTTQEYSNYDASRNTSAGINSSVKLFNGFRAENAIKQSKLGYEASQYDIETIKESVSLNVLNAYLQVLYANEQVKNSEKQVESTSGQLFLAKERLNLGAISTSDYLLVKSELASEQLTLANAQSLLVNNKVALMQLMELPVTSAFTVEYPVFNDSMYAATNVSSDSIYEIALTEKPQIKSSGLKMQMAKLGVDMAKSDYLPVLSLNGGITSGYYLTADITRGYQFKNKISPGVGFTLSIPVYQNKQAKTNVSLAKISNENAYLDDLDIRNQLRKDIEQACTGVNSAEKQYGASLQKYMAVKETYNVATEKYGQGLMNSVDFIIQKTNYINAESDLLQSKFNLVFTYKILDYYKGKALTF